MSNKNDKKSWLWKFLKSQFIEQPVKTSLVIREASLTLKQSRIARLNYKKLMAENSKIELQLDLINSNSNVSEKDRFDAISKLRKI